MMKNIKNMGYRIQTENNLAICHTQHLKKEIMPISPMMKNITDNYEVKDSNRKYSYNVTLSIVRLRKAKVEFDHQI